MRAHTAIVTRQTAGPTNPTSGKIPQVQVTVSHSFECFIEPLKGKFRDDVVMRFPEARFIMSGPTEGQPTLKVNDVITWKARTFVIIGIEEDDSRPVDESEIEPYCLVYLKQVI